MRLMRFTVRRMMIAVAVVALLMAAGSCLRPRLAPTPAEWALKCAAASEEWDRAAVAWGRKPGRDWASKYRELARRYAADKAPWDEENFYGPYLKRLSTGQPVFVHWAVQASPVPSGAGVAIAARTPCVVVRERGGDEDDAMWFREVEVRIVQGPHAGLTVAVEREYLRCK